MTMKSQATFNPEMDIAAYDKVDEILKEAAGK